MEHFENGDKVLFTIDGENSALFLGSYLDGALEIEWEAYNGDLQSLAATRGRFARALYDFDAMTFTTNCPTHGSHEHPITSVQVFRTK